MSVKVKITRVVIHEQMIPVTSWADMEQHEIKDEIMEFADDVALYDGASDIVFDNQDEYTTLKTFVEFVDVEDV